MAKALWDMTSPFAFVTLLSSDSYLPGALVLAASLKELHPIPAQHPEVDFQTVCLVTPETVDVKSIKALRKAFDVVIGVELIEAPSSQGLDLLGECPSPPCSVAFSSCTTPSFGTYWSIFCSHILFAEGIILPKQSWDAFPLPQRDAHRRLRDGYHLTRICSLLQDACPSPVF